jgi:signal transduction histidine kinase
MKKTGPRTSSQVKMLLLGLSLVIPGLLISIIGIGSVTRQKQARAIQLAEQWQRQLELITIGMEKSINSSIKAVFTSLAKEPLDIDRPLRIQQRLKNLLAAHPIVTYPFVITDKHEYLFPFTRPMISQPAQFDFSVFSSSTIKRQFQAGENLELEKRDWLAAIKKYLACAQESIAGREKAIFFQAIGRCYFKWGKYQQALQYLHEAVADQGLNGNQDRYQQLQARQLLALTYERMGAGDSVADCYLGIYENILALQAASKSLLLDFYKNEALDYLNRQISRSASLQERLSKALRQERLETIPAQEMSLRWQFFSSPELDQDGAAVSRQGIEFKRLQQVQEFYLVNDIKKLFYTKLQKELPLLSSEPVPGKGPQTTAGFIYLAALQVAYVPLPFEKQSAGRAFFGFHIALAQIQQVLFPALQKQYWPEANPAVILSTGAEAAAMAKDNLPQLALEKLLPGYVLAVKAPRSGYLAARISRELLVNYALIASLLLTLFVAVALFFRSLRRDLELLELKNRFLDSAAHTLKTPLARIRMLAEQLQLNWLKNEEQRAAQSGRIIVETDRMNDLIGNLLDLSRIEAGQKTYRLQKASLPEIAGQAWAEALPLLQENGFVCRAEIAEEMPMFAFDARALRMVIGNLIQNALNYSLDRKEIELKVYGSADEAVLEVADSGLGIAPEYHEAIFDKFFRVEGAETSASQGSGLGLFLVKHVVDAHGGRIKVESAAGQGSRFIIYLPMAAAVSRQGKKRKPA